MLEIPPLQPSLSELSRLPPRMKHYKKKITYKLLFLDFKSVVFLGVIHVGLKSLIQRPGLLRDLTTHQEQGS